MGVAGHPHVLVAFAMVDKGIEDINPTIPTRLLGFESMNYNVVYAQMGRGKTERIVAQALGSIAATVGKLAYDACLFNSQNFGFIKLPDQSNPSRRVVIERSRGNDEP